MRETKVFQLGTGVASRDRRELRAAIFKLGARLSDDDDSRAVTHLVVDVPTRSEKFLKGVGRGCWIVSKEFVWKSEAAGKWLDEEAFEICEEFLEGLSPALAKSAVALTRMARCSRRLVAEVGVNVFVAWRVCLVVTGVSLKDNRMEIFKNIVIAGGGTCYLVHFKHMINFIRSDETLTHILGFGFDNLQSILNIRNDAEILSELKRLQSSRHFYLGSPDAIREAFYSIEKNYALRRKKVRSDVPTRKPSAKDQADPADETAHLPYLTKMALSGMVPGEEAGRRRHSGLEGHGASTFTFSGISFDPSMTPLTPLTTTPLNFKAYSSTSNSPSTGATPSSVAKRVAGLSLGSPSAILRNKLTSQVAGAGRLSPLAVDTTATLNRARASTSQRTVVGDSARAFGLGDRNINDLMESNKKEENILPENMNRHISNFKDRKPIDIADKDNNDFLNNDRNIIDFDGVFEDDDVLPDLDDDPELGYGRIKTEVIHANAEETVMEPKVEPTVDDFVSATSAEKDATPDEQSSDNTDCGEVFFKRRKIRRPQPLPVETQKIGKRSFREEDDDEQEMHLTPPKKSRVEWRSSLPPMISHPSLPYAQRALHPNVAVVFSPSFEDPVARKADEVDFKHLVDAIESLFLVTTATQFPSPDLVGGLARVLAAVDTTNPREIAVSPASTAYLISLRFLRFGVKYLRHLLALHPPSGCGPTSTVDLRQKMYDEIIRGFSPTLSPISKDQENLWSCLNRVIVSCFLERNEAGDGLPVNEIRRCNVSHQKNLEFLSFVIEVLEVDLTLYFEELNNAAVSHSRQPLVTRLFWCTPSSQTEDTFLVLTSQVRDFGRLLGVGIVACLQSVIEGDVDASNFEALKKMLKLSSLMAEYARFRDWKQTDESQTPTHSTHVGPAASNLAAFMASIVILETEERKDFLKLIVDELSSDLPWFAFCVSRKLLDNECSADLLQPQLKLVPEQALLYHIVSRYFYLVPRRFSSSHSKVKRERPATEATLSSMAKEDGLAKNRQVRPNRVNAKNKFGETKLHTACKKGDLEAVRLLLTSPELLVNAQDNNLWTPLHEACNAGHVKVVDALLRHKPLAPGELRDGRSAVEKNPFADLTAKSLEGITPLHDAVLCNRLEVVRLLLEHPVGHKILLDYDSPASRGNRSHSEFPSLLCFAETSPAMKTLLQTHLKQSVAPTFSYLSSFSQSKDDSQISEGSQSQNFCPSESQYDEMFPPPTEIPRPKTSTDKEQRNLQYPADTPIPGSAPRYIGRPYETRDVETMLHLQISLLSSYLNFMDSHSVVPEIQVEDKFVYGDSRVLRRLPKHAKNLQRHILRLVGLCEGDEISVEMRDLLEKLACCFENNDVFAAEKKKGP